MPFIGGNPALDFVNTAEERGHPDAGDALRTPGDLSFWGRRYGLLDESADGKNDRAEFRRAIEARELLYALFFALSRDRPVSPDDLERLAALAASAYRAASLEPTPDGRLEWSWDRSQLATVRHVAVTSAVELLADTPGARLKQCPGDHCGWFFLDRTKRGNRRWCAMTGGCGQSAKNAHRRITTAAQTPRA